MIFNKTHRLLVKSTDVDYKYHTVEIDINTGFYRRTEVASANTLIRVKKGIYGEQLCSGNNKIPLDPEDIELLEIKFNSIRESKGWNNVTFRKSEEVEDEVSSSSKVQGQEEAEVK